MQWMKPNWEQDRDCWPYVGDPFLAAVEVRTAAPFKDSFVWEFMVLCWDEDGLVYFDSGDTFDNWAPEVIQWIAKIPEPPKG